MEDQLIEVQLHILFFVFLSFYDKKIYINFGSYFKNSKIDIIMIDKK